MTKSILYVLFFAVTLLADFGLWVAMGESGVGILVAVAFILGALTQFLLAKAHDDYQEGYQDGQASLGSLRL